MFATMHTRVTQLIALVAVVAAVFVSAASATPPFITDTLTPGGGKPVSTPHFITDTLASGGNAAPTTDYHFIPETLAPGGGASGVVTIPADNGFSWTDAGVGAISACGLILLALTGRQLVGRRRRGQLAF